MCRGIICPSDTMRFSYRQYDVKLPSLLQSRIRLKKTEKGLKFTEAKGQGVSNEDNFDLKHFSLNVLVSLIINILYFSSSVKITDLVYSITL